MPDIDPSSWFGEALARSDSNKDGKISKDEIADPRAKNRFDEYLDLDNSGYLEERDWEQYREHRHGENGLRAYRLDGKGDLTESNLLWKNPRSLPNVPSPLVYRGVLYTLKEGGILTSFDLSSGEILKQARLQGAPGDYYASPVAADGKIWAISEEGKAVVIQAGAQWQILRVNDLGDGCKGTPAIAGHDLGLRSRRRGLGGVDDPLGRLGAGGGGGRDRHRTVASGCRASCSTRATALTTCSRRASGRA